MITNSSSGGDMPQAQAGLWVKGESESHIGGPILSGWVGLGAKCDLNQIFGCRSKVNEQLT